MTKTKSEWTINFRRETFIFLFLLVDKVTLTNRKISMIKTNCYGQKTWLDYFWNCTAYGGWLRPFAVSNYQQFPRRGKYIGMQKLTHMESKRKFFSSSTSQQKGYCGTNRSPKQNIKQTAEKEPVVYILVLDPRGNL